MLRRIRSFFTRRKALKTKTISPDKLPELLHACYVNACSLYEEAKLLETNKKYPRAYFLASIALEELAKPPLMVNALYFDPEHHYAWKQLWSDFYSHEPKQRAIKNYGQTLFKSLANDAWEEFFSEHIPERAEFNNAKLSSLYVDFAQGRVMTPESQYPDAQSVAGLLKSLKGRLDAFKDLYSSLDKSKRFISSFEHMPIVLNGKPLKDAVIDDYTRRGKELR